MVEHFSQETCDIGAAAETKKIYVIVIVTRHEEFICSLASAISILSTLARAKPTITCSSKDVPTAESFAFIYHELSRANVLVCDKDLVFT